MDKKSYSRRGAGYARASAACEQIEATFLVLCVLPVSQ